MPIRRLVLIAHRWIGLPASVVLAVAGSTGIVLLWPGGGLLKRAAGRLHETLAMGRIGSAIVIGGTIAAVLLQASGLYLWWRRKSFRVRTDLGWITALADLHHASGVVGLAFMLTLAGTAAATALMPIGMAPDMRRLLETIHTARAFPAPVKWLYAAGASAFLVQGASGVVMWWNRRDLP